MDVTWVRLPQSEPPGPWYLGSQASLTFSGVPCQPGSRAPPDRTDVTSARTGPGRCGSGTVPAWLCGRSPGAGAAAGTDEAGGKPAPTRPRWQAARRSGLTPEEPHPCHIATLPAAPPPLPDRCIQGHQGHQGHQGRLETQGPGDRAAAAIARTG